MTTLKRSHPEEDAISCLLIGTESQQVHILDPEAFTVLATVSETIVAKFFEITWPVVANKKSSDVVNFVSGKVVYRM